MVVPTPSPTHPADPKPQDARRRFGGVVPVGAVLLLVALASIAVYLLAPGPFGAERMGSQATPTSPVAVTTPAPAGTPLRLTKTPVDGTPTPDALTRLVQAETLTRQSAFEEAIALCEDLASQLPDDAYPEIGWAWALLLDGRAVEALAHARRAVELESMNPEAAIALAYAYVETGDQDRGLAMAQNAVKLDPLNDQAHAVLAWAYLHDGQIQKAVEEADLALARDPDSAEVHRIRGWLYQAVDGDLEQAVGELQTAAELQPELWLWHHELGLLLLEAQAYDQAVTALKNALALRSKAQTYAAIGDAYYRLEQYDRSKSFLEQALSAGDDSLDTRALLATIHAQQDRCDDAEIYIEQILAEDPSQSLALKARDTCQGPPPARPTPAPTEPPPSLPNTDGRIAYPVWNAEKGKYDTYVSNADGSDRHLVVEEMHQPAFSPDGQWLAVNGERNLAMNLFIVRPDGSDLTEITEHIEDSLPYWSPDGKGLVFSSTQHPDRQSRVYIIDTVSFEGDRMQGRHLQSDLYEVLGERPSWTPDGLIVYKGCDHTVTPVQCGLFLMPADLGPQIPSQLTTHPEDTAPAVHGSRIAFMSNRDGNWEIYAVQADGSELKRLTHSAANDGLPTWSPDGQTIAFVSDRDGVWAVWAMDPDGANQHKLFDLGGGGLALDWQHESISWGP